MVMVKVIVTDQGDGGPPVGEFVTHLGGVRVDDHLGLAAGQGKTGMSVVFNQHVAPFEPWALAPAGLDARDLGIGRETLTPYNRCNIWEAAWSASPRGPDQPAMPVQAWTSVSKVARGARILMHEL